ncbi:hypothetical protein [Neisseria bacilliformis]|uniref:hypothetical protein n=1 Tax=Neisseria bacilliformis TaxID=267212 RepID=UPI0028E9A92C|nr:hypothetical protein [Neisseria bacilliformis]
MNPGFPRFFMLFVLFVLVLCGGSQAYRLYDGRAEARRILRDTVAELRRRLPPPDKADAAAMPQKLPRLREGMLYYAERKAYKYTFDYTFDEHNPEFLERRSIWLSPQGGRWRCWAGVKDSVRGADSDCGERAIVAGLTEREHALAKANWCGRLAAANTPDWQNGPVYVVFVPPKKARGVEQNVKEKVKVRAVHFAQAHLVLYTADWDTVWQLELPDGAKSLTLIGSEIYDGETSAVSEAVIKNSFDYPNIRKKCVELPGGAELSGYYSEDMWQDATLAAVFRNPAVHPIITVAEGAEPAILLDAAGQGAGRLKNETAQTAASQGD